ncbi:rCG46327, partial [Rattus norvegicus]
MAATCGLKKASSDSIYRSCPVTHKW